MAKMCIKFIVSVLMAAHTVSATKYLAQKPNFFNSCYFEDPNFNNCFGNNFQLLIKEWRDGIPGLKSAGKFDPLHVKRVKLSHDSGGSVSLHTDLHNVDITGASQLIVTDASYNKEPWIFSFKVLLPKLRFDADYKLKGRLLTFPLNGTGRCYFEAENVDVAIKIDLILRDEHDLTFTDVKSLKVNLRNVEKFHMHLDNLFNGQKTLEDSVNELINENWRQFYDVLKPALQETMEAILADRFTKVFSYVPSNYLIADFPRAADFASQ